MILPFKTPNCTGNCEGSNTTAFINTVDERAMGGLLMKSQN